MVEQDRIAHVVASHEQPVVTVGDVLDALDEEASDTHIRQQMDLLAASGTLERKEAGARAVVYWHEERVTEPRDDPADHPDQTDLRYPQATEQRETAQEEPESDVALVAQLDLPGQGTVLTERQQAVLAALDLLDEEGTAKAGTIRESVFESHPAGFETADSLWKNCLQTALSDLRDAGRVELYNKHAGEWRSAEAVDALEGDGGTVVEEEEEEAPDAEVVTVCNDCDAVQAGRTTFCDECGSEWIRQEERSA